MKKIFLLLFLFDFIFAQEYNLVEKHGSVTFVSSTLIYTSLNRSDSVKVDDTISVVSNGEVTGILKIIAVSKSSSAAEIIKSEKEILINDSVKFYFKMFNEISKNIETIDAIKLIQPIEVKEIIVVENIKPKMNVNGRVGLQHIGSWTQGANINFNQSAFLTRLNIENIFESDLRLNFYGRTYYNLHKTNDNKSITRFYDLSIEQQNPNSFFHYTIGRQTSRYVGGLGILDGIQSVFNFDNLKVGAIFGAEPHHTNFGVDGDDKKYSLFLNYTKTFENNNKYEGNFAYATQLYEGKIDREFLYLQNTFFNSSNFSIYQSAEYDLNEINRGVIKKNLNLTNTFVSANFIPINWLSVYVGFDAMRSIYLLETMKSIPDTLFDKNLLFGYRLSSTFRMPNNLSLTLNGSIRTKKSNEKNNYLVSGNFRASDVFNSGLSLNTRVSTNSGLYTKGNNFTLEADKNITQMVLLSMRFDYYAYEIFSTNKNYSTGTTTATMNWRISDKLFFITSMDYVSELNMRSFRYFGEISVRF